MMHMGLSGVQREIRGFSLISPSSLDNCRAVWRWIGLGEAETSLDTV